MLRFSIQVVDLLYSDKYSLLNSGAASDNLVAMEVSQSSSSINSQYLFLDSCDGN